MEYNSIKKSLNSCLKSGLSGAIAMALQIVSLMWLHTTIAFQYKSGNKHIIPTVKHLVYKGGVRRFYQGLLPALIQGPLGRFGDTASSELVLGAFRSSTKKDIPIFLQTCVASPFAALWKIFLMPINTLQTMKQVEGNTGFNTLRLKVNTYGLPVLYHGSSVEFVTTFSGHLFWFGTYNTLDQNISKPTDSKLRILRHGGMGIISSMVTDCSINWIRVLKTFRQSHKEPISYSDSLEFIVKMDGSYLRFATRGLSTRLTFSCLQGCMFSIFWNHFKSNLLKNL